MNKIQIRRSPNVGAPAAGTLQQGELAWVDHSATDVGGTDGCLYIGDMKTGTALVRKIGGTGSSSFVTDILETSALTGVPTAPTAGPSVNTTQLATTAFVQTAVAGGTVAIENASDTNMINKAAGHVLLYDGIDTWDNKPLTGDVTINKDGLTSVISVSQTAVVLGTDTQGPYLATLANTDGNLVVTGVGAEDAAAVINLATDVTIAGNLIVAGQTTEVRSTIVTIEDPIFTLGENVAGVQDRGIAMKYTATDGKFAWMGMDVSDDKFKYIPVALNSGEVITGAVGKAAFSEINGLLMDATQTNITEIGTITTGAWQADEVGPEWGGTGINTSTANGGTKHTGVPSINGGSWDVTAELATSLGGTGLNAVAANGILLGGGAGQDMTVLTLATGATAVGMALKIGATGPEWSNVMDGGTFA